MLVECIDILAATAFIWYLLLIFQSCSLGQGFFWETSTCFLLNILATVQRLFFIGSGGSLPACPGFPGSLSKVVP